MPLVVVKEFAVLASNHLHDVLVLKARIAVDRVTRGDAQIAMLWVVVANILSVAGVDDYAHFSSLLTP